MVQGGPPQKGGEEEPTKLYWLEPLLLGEQADSSQYNLGAVPLAKGVRRGIENY